jgi:hypothetical protein
LLQIDALCEVDRRLVGMPEAVRNSTLIAVDYRVASRTFSPPIRQSDGAPKRDQ